MINYIRADMHRILTRFKHVFFVLVCVGALGVMTWTAMAQVMQVNGVVLINSLLGNVGMLAVVMGCYEMLCITSDDYKARSIQAAIGRGVSRTKVIFAKVIEFALLMIIDALLVLVMSLGLCAAFGVEAPAEMMRQLIITLGCSFVFGSIIAGTLTLSVSLMTQSSVMTILVYCLLNVGLVSFLLELITTIPALSFLADLNLTSYLMSSRLASLQSQLVLGSFDVLSMGICLAYLVLFFAVGISVINKKEFDL